MQTDVVARSCIKRILRINQSCDTYSCAIPIDLSDEAHADGDIALTDADAVSVPSQGCIDKGKRKGRRGREVLEVIGDIVFAVTGAVFAEERLCGGACRGWRVVAGRGTREIAGRHGYTQDNTRCSAEEDGRRRHSEEEEG